MNELIAILTMGDGYINKEGRIVVEHSVKQEDFLNWKKELIEKEFNVKLHVYHNIKKNTKSIYLDRKSIFLPLREFGYVNNKKVISNFLSLVSVENSDFALAMLLFDDAAINRASIKLCVCDSNEEDINKISQWLKDRYKITSYIRYEKHNNYKKSYPFLIINEFETMVVWSHIKKYVNNIPSMRHKFRNIILKYNEKYNQLEYNRPTSPRLLKIRNGELFQADKVEVIKYYNHVSSLKRTAKFYNVTEKIMRDFLVNNNALHPKGFKPERR
jgi:hypothetical protein